MRSDIIKENVYVFKFTEEEANLLMVIIHAEPRKNEPEGTRDLRTDIFRCLSEMGIDMHHKRTCTT